jgi:hypothetical protein
LNFYAGGGGGGGAAGGGGGGGAAFEGCYSCWCGGCGGSGGGSYIDASGTVITEVSGVSDPLGDGNGEVIIQAIAPLQITSITQTGTSIAINWNTGGIGTTNELQATAGAAYGNYSSNTFATIFAVTNTVGPATNYLDAGGATNQPARYYRVVSP